METEDPMLLQGELNIDDELFKTNKGGTNFMKNLEDILANKLIA